MSGIETIGVLASAAQLVDILLKIAESFSELYKRIHNAPSRISYYIEEVKLFIATADFIKDHSNLLETPFVRSTLNTTLFKATSLSNVLEKVEKEYTQGSASKRYWNRIKGNKESRIIYQFEQLQCAKTQLALCIHVDYNSKLTTVQNSVDHLALLLKRDSSGTMSFTGDRASSYLISERADSDKICVSNDTPPEHAKKSGSVNFWILNHIKRFRVDYKKYRYFQDRDYIGGNTSTNGSKQFNGNVGKGFARPVVVADNQANANAKQLNGHTTSIKFATDFFK